ncbi:MAG: dihydroxyacetone kinase phosphoryl donor subunit DhaM, partial [Solirubrobacteraceae bacterium]
MVGIVIVSHSEALARGVVELAREMGGPDVAIEAAGGLGEPGVLGTDAERVRAAVQTVMSADGVLVLMDLGSALMSAEFALELLEDGADRVRLSDAPLVEGAVAAAAAAGGGADLDEVAAEARGALRMKASQLESSDTPAVPAPALADATAELAVRNAAGLHARPAARFVETARRFDADVRVAHPGGEAVSARSLTNVIALGARPGDTVVVSASGPQADEALAALRELAADGFGDGVASGSGSGSTGAPPPAPTATPATAAPAAAAPAAAPPSPGNMLRGVALAGGIVVGPSRRLAPAGQR